MQTMQQQRAKHALSKVKELAAKDKKEHSKLRSRASELPFMIHANGLGQALAFFKSKGGKDGYDHLYSVLATWLVGDGSPLQGAKDALEGVTQCDLRTYRVAQAEAIQYMEWVKKFASAYLYEEKEGSDS